MTTWGPLAFVPVGVLVGYFLWALMTRAEKRERGL